MQKANRVPRSAYHEWHGTIFLYCKIIRVVVGGVVIVFGELIVSWALDVGAPSLPSSFENSGSSILSTGASSSRSPRQTAV